MTNQGSITRQVHEGTEPSLLLKQTADNAAMSLLIAFRRDVVVRFNAGGRSGGAFLVLDADSAKTVGVSMKQADDLKIELYALISGDYLAEVNDANQGLGSYRYLYETGESIPQIIETLKRLSNLETL